MSNLDTLVTRAREMMVMSDALSVAVYGDDDGSVPEHVREQDSPAKLLHDLIGYLSDQETPAPDGSASLISAAPYHPRFNIELAGTGLVIHDLTGEDMAALSDLHYRQMEELKWRAEIANLAMSTGLAQCKAYRDEIHGVRLLQATTARAINAAHQHIASLEETWHGQGEDLRAAQRSLDEAWKERDEARAQRDSYMTTARAEVLRLDEELTRLRTEKRAGASPPEVTVVPVDIGQHGERQFDVRANGLLICTENSELDAGITANFVRDAFAKLWPTEPRPAASIPGHVGNPTAEDLARFIERERTAEPSRGWRPSTAIEILTADRDEWKRRALAAEPRPAADPLGISKLVEARTKAIFEAKERYVEAWIAETGLMPSESMIEERLEGDTWTIRVVRAPALQAAPPVDVEKRVADERANTVMECVESLCSLAIDPRCGVVDTANVTVGRTNLFAVCGELQKLRARSSGRDGRGT